jgi:hypothetical protein
MSQQDHICEICGVNKVPFQHIRAGGSVRFICSSCETIILKYEEKKKAHVEFIKKIISERNKQTI